MQKQRNFRLVQARNSAALWLLALLIGCNAASRADESETQKIQEALVSARRLRSIERSFEKRHPDKGAVVKTFVDDLRADGLRCRIQYRQKFVQASGDGLGQFAVTPEPVIHCDTDHFSDPNCSEFRVTVSVEWKEDTAPLARLASQLSQSSVREAYFTCVRTHSSDSDRKAIVEAIRNGLAIPIR